MSCGTHEALERMKTQLEANYQVKTQTLGTSKDQCQQIQTLNRIVEWHGQKGIAYETDPRHVELVIEQQNLKDANIVSTPGTRDEGRTEEDREEMLSEKEATKYRAVIARCNHLSPDRPDIAYAVKGLARGIADPTHGDMQRFRRLGRYLKGTPRLQQWYDLQFAQAVVNAYSDAGWAGCSTTCWIHRQPMSMWRVLPRPCLSMMPSAALASPQNSPVSLQPTSLNIANIPSVSAAASKAT